MLALVPIIGPILAAVLFLFSGITLAFPILKLPLLSTITLALIF
ncbi:MAG TPA: hypothetical protein VED16_05325 [Candidatus Acidoferrum sp.]|nr:hypothetical protein [Candidatus Acidoferrum sp.]